MAYLTLNGITIPVAIESPTLAYNDIGTRGRGFSGQPYSNIQKRKRNWTFETTPLTEMEALAFEGVINGTGDFWSFDSDTSSSKGLVDTSSAPASVSASSPLFGDKSLITSTSTSTRYTAGMFSGWLDMTINFWTNRASGAASSNLEAAFIGHEYHASNVVGTSYILVGSGANNFKWTTSITGTTTEHTMDLTSNTFDGNLHMWTFVLRKNLGAGEYNKQAYLDGVSIGSATTVNLPTPENWYNFSIGSSDDSGSGDDYRYFNGRLDNFLVVPYAATSDVISGWYSWGDTNNFSPTDLPNLWLSGDCIPETKVKVIGKMEAKTAQIGSRFILSFNITEV